jgi:hypothetical protein
MLEVVVHFVDIGGIGDHHCLNFLFKILFAQIYGHVTNRAGNHYRKLRNNFNKLNPER